MARRARVAGLNTIQQGQAAVHRVVSELMFRGVRCALPCVDDHGVDLYADRVRIQVKSATLRFGCGYPQGAYWFRMVHGPYIVGGKIERRRPRAYSRECDFIVLMGIDEGKFWIVPSHLLDHATEVTLCLGPQGFYKRSDFEEARALRAVGLTQQEIADKMGVSQSAVSYQLRGGRRTLPKKTKSGIVREHEGRWDLVVSAARTVSAVDDLAFHPSEPSTSGVVAHMPGASR